MNALNWSTAKWRKSLHSGDTGGQCVEAAAVPPAIAVRDSKDPQGAKLVLGSSAWRALVVEIKGGQHDLA
ncbi:DUF397 domain-containing protein [Actinomadura adrarensis]|uniref:DUF397 domain-containing protein n=1 Tax=Actinomadura adrarensis TaxID=1819600 RepID=A0ABW3CB74_9ACTN